VTRLLALVVRRLAWFVPTLLGLLAVTFVISRVIPADPVALLAGETATPAQVAALRQQLGLDRPLPVQFADYVLRLARGDMGTSLYTTRPIAEDLAHRLPATIELTLVAMAFSVAVGIPLGVVSALWRNSALDHALRLVTVSGLAIASFWLGIMLQLLFAMRLGWTPLNGRLQGFPPRELTGLYLVDAALTADVPAFGAALAHLALPAATLAFPALATLVRFTRAGVLEVMQSNFVLYERAMGLPASVIVWKYMLRSALTSTVTQIGLLFGILLAGAVVTEAVFDWPGIGTYAVNSIIRSDYSAVMGFTVWAGAIFLVVNLLVDLAHTVIDPRERVS
jgi:peptide/nickel transport system permease protein